MTRVCLFGECVTYVCVFERVCVGVGGDAVCSVFVYWCMYVLGSVCMCLGSVTCVWVCLWECVYM